MVKIIWGREVGWGERLSPHFSRGWASFEAAGKRLVLSPNALPAQSNCQEEGNPPCHADSPLPKGESCGLAKPHSLPLHKACPGSQAFQAQYQGSLFCHSRHRSRCHTPGWFPQQSLCQHLLHVGSLSPRSTTMTTTATLQLRHSFQSQQREKPSTGTIPPPHGIRCVTFSMHQWTSTHCPPSGNTNRGNPKGRTTVLCIGPPDMHKGGCEFCCRHI